MHLNRNACCDGVLDPHAPRIATVVDVACYWAGGDKQTHQPNAGAFDQCPVVEFFCLMLSLNVTRAAGIVYCHCLCHSRFFLNGLRSHYDAPSILGSCGASHAFTLAHDSE